MSDESSAPVHGARATHVGRVGLLSTEAVIALTIFALTQFFWSRSLEVLPQAVNWLDDVLVVGLGFLALTRPPPSTSLSHKWCAALAVFFVVALVGAIANSVPFARAILGLRGVLIYLPLYYAVVVSDLSRADVQRSLATVLVLALVQLPLQITQFAFGAAQSGIDFAIIGDSAYGTFGPGMANVLGLFMIPFVCFGVGMWLSGRGRPWLAVAGICGVSLVLSSGRASMMLLPLFVVWMVALTIGWRRLASPRHMLTLFIVAVVIAASAEAYYRVTSGAGLAERLSPKTLIREQLTYTPVSAGRLAYYPITFDVLATEAASPWIGLGPGNYASGAGYLTNAPGLNLIRDVFGQWETGRETALNSQFLTSLGEFGILGVLAFYLLIALLVRRTFAVRRSEQDVSIRVALAAVAIAQVVFIIGTLVEQVWEDQVIAFPFWLSAALVVKLAEQSSSPRNARSPLSVQAQSVPNEAGSM